MAQQPPVSDFSSVPDDASPIPAAPFSIVADIPAVDDNSPDNVADDSAIAKEAAVYWHPAWEPVQKKFEDLLEAYDGNNVVQFKDEPAAEFKIKVLANQVVRTEIQKIMEDVKRAVESVEQRPKPAKQPSPKK